MTDKLPLKNVYISAMNVIFKITIFLPSAVSFLCFISKKQTFHLIWTFPFGYITLERRKTITDRRDLWHAIGFFFWFSERGTPENFWEKNILKRMKWGGETIPCFRNGKFQATNRTDLVKLLSIIWPRWSSGLVSGSVWKCLFFLLTPWCFVSQSSWRNLVL